nr:hypothetical protein [Leisingera sp.]
MDLGTNAEMLVYLSGNASLGNVSHDPKGRPTNSRNHPFYIVPNAFAANSLNEVVTIIRHPEGATKFSSFLKHTRVHKKLEMIVTPALIVGTPVGQNAQKNRIIVGLDFEEQTAYQIVVSLQ